MQSKEILFKALKYVTDMHISFQFFKNTALLNALVLCNLWLEGREVSFKTNKYTFLQVNIANLLWAQPGVRFQSLWKSHFSTKVKVIKAHQSL